MADSVCLKCLFLALVTSIKCFTLDSDNSGNANITAIVGEYLILDCERNGTNVTSNQLIWRYNKEVAYSGFTPLPAISNISLDHSNYSLLIEEAQILHTGIYTCEYLGKVLARYNIEVKVAEVTTHEVDIFTNDQFYYSSTTTNCETYDVVTHIEHHLQTTRGSITCLRTPSLANSPGDNASVDFATTDEQSSFFMVLNGCNVSDGDEITFESDDVLTASCYVFKVRAVNKFTWMINNHVVNTSKYSYKSSCVEMFDFSTKPQYRLNEVKSRPCLQDRSLERAPQCITVNFVMYENVSRNLPASIMAIAITVSLFCVVICGYVLLYLKGCYHNYLEKSSISVSGVSPEMDIYSDAEHTLYTSTEEVLNDNVMTSIQCDNVIIEFQLPGNGPMTYSLASVSETNERLIVKSVCDKEDISFMMSFREMAKQLQALKKHENIIEIIGIDITEVPYYIYSEYHGNGNLRNYMLQQYPEKRHSQFIHPRRKQTISPEEEKVILAGFALDILEGITFLFENNYRHPALTTAKVLITSSGKCKLFDFVPEDLTTEILSRKIQKKNPPIAWLAPEYIFFGQYCEKSDVWSLAVAFWEIFSLGKTPYVGLSRNEIETNIRNQQYLGQPICCPGSIFSMMLSCWDVSPEARPSFDRLRQQLRHIFRIMNECSNTSTEETQDPLYYMLEETANHYSDM